MFRSRSLIAGWVVSAVVAAACSAYGATPTFTFVAMPDIQNETQNHPEMLQAQVDWILDNRVSKNIVCMAQQGDLTNNANDTEFTTAHNKLFQLVTNAPSLPWGTLPGNHDSANLTKYTTYFGPSNFSGVTWYNSGYSGYNSYEKFTVNGRTFLLMNLQNNPSTAALNWAQGILSAPENKSLPTIINTHDYMTYASTHTRSTVGEKIWSTALTGNPDGLINGNSQVFMVVCGHNHDWWNQTSTDKEGKPVFELMADYQSQTSGNGYLRLYEFDEDASMIRVKTYSTYAGTYKTDALNQFNISVDFDARFGAIPEPASLGLLAVGAMGLLMKRRSRR